MATLLDTGFLYAVLDTADAHHEAALGVVDRLRSGELGTSVTTTWVATELMTLVRARGTRPEFQRRAWQILQSWPGLRLLDVSKVSLPDICDVFERYPRLSFTDASHLVVMREHGIDRLATFDHGFQGIVSVVPQQG